MTKRKRPQIEIENEKRMTIRLNLPFWQEIKKLQADGKCGSFQEEVIKHFIVLLEKEEFVF